MPKEFFSQTYTESRHKFRGLLSEVARPWPQAALHALPVGPECEGLTVDVITAPPPGDKKHLLILTCGLHGIEGYAGAAVLQYFCQRFLPYLHPMNTGLLLVHALNPWGMHHRRRTNENNVDLNRNFLPDWKALDPKSFNPAYTKIDPFLNPPSPLGRAAALAFYPQAAGKLLSMGMDRFKAAALLGQYRYARGVYYGGREEQVSTTLMQDLFNQEAPLYKNILLLDMHTGYGPRYQMTLTCSPLETMSSTKLKQAFDYPQIAKTNPQEFYGIQGDMVDYFYRHMQQCWPEIAFFAAALEFGTLGDSLTAGMKSIRAIINENRVYHWGAPSPAQAKEARRQFSELFIPQEEGWRKKALEDADRAIRGILAAREFC